MTANLYMDESEDDRTESKRGRPKAVSDKLAKLEEVFDQHKLSHIINNETLYRDRMRTRCFEDDSYNPFTIAGKYLAKSKGGAIKTTYKQNSGFGRFHAVGSMSMQSMSREIRHTIANEFYVDIDIKNAHPVILSFMCEERGIACKYLNKYNKKRDEFLAELCADRDQAKTAVLSMINGGKKAVAEIENPPAWLDSFKKELKNIHKKFAKDPAFKPHKEKRVSEGVDYNHEASYMNTLLCEFENKTLQAIYKAIGSPKDCVWCFDGLMVRKGTSFDLFELEKAVATALGIEIQLAEKPMNEGFSIDPQEITPYVEIKTNCFNFTDPYNYKDFHTELINNSHFETYEEMETVLTPYTQVIAHILQGEGCFIKKLKNGELDIVKRLKTSNIKLTYGDSKKVVSLEDYLCGKPSFGQIACELENCPDDDFNLWTGFQAKRVATASDSEGFKLIKSFILETWANNNEEYYNYIISWFAGLVCNLGSINKVALAMVSGQGTGKGTLIEFMGWVLREVNIVSTTGIQSITGRFNTILQGKRLVNINEMSSTKEEFKSNFDKIKSYITDPKVMIEPKGVNPYSIKNISNFVLFTNHRDAIIVEETDRRYAIFEMSSAHMNDNEYFGRIRRECFNQDVANEFYTYLLDFPAVPIIQIPDTELRREMMNMSKPSPLKFLDAVRDENFYEGIEEVGAGIIYDRYKQWCSDNGERTVFSSTKFGTIVSVKLQKRRTNRGLVYVMSGL